MSATVNEEVKCPEEACGEVFDAELCCSVNAKQSPELKEKLMGGELNVVRCPKCGTVFYAEYFIIYLDPEVKLLAFVYPEEYAKDRPAWEKKMNEEFRCAQAGLPEKDKLDYSPAIFFGMDSLVELLENEEMQSDEAAVLENVSDNLGLSLIKIHPAGAREKRLPRLLPRVKLGGDHSLREEIAAGLEKLVDAMPEMAFYKKALETVVSDGSLEIKPL